MRSAHVLDRCPVLARVSVFNRPGGCLVTQFHLYTSDSGGHDVRVRQGMPYWAHLRPQHAARARNAAYIQLFGRMTAGCSYAYWTDKDLDQKRQILGDLRERDELADYTDQELLTLNLVC